MFQQCEVVYNDHQYIFEVDLKLHFVQQVSITLLDDVSKIYDTLELPEHTHQ
ncbi:unnamed protein product [Schistosoma margrebowiei]|uniref:Uncharacterized protein n=1 Tax=Schistosoma margrebowiei TaxID=48269 RepID=A0A183N7F1_9TREM|nr:unnamed protein product [Schistosoma margrebowiei]